MDFACSVCGGYLRFDLQGVFRERCEEGSGLRRRCTCLIRKDLVHLRPRALLWGS